jgi:hypothetical protein
LSTKCNRKKEVLFKYIVYRKIGPRKKKGRVKEDNGRACGRSIYFLINNSVKISTVASLMYLIKLNGGKPYGLSKILIVCMEKN